MKIKPHIKAEHLITLGILILVSAGFSFIQLTKAGVTGPHNPGHPWNQIDKPADCTTGQYVYGADDNGWLCSTPSGSGGSGTIGAIVSYTTTNYLTYFLGGWDGVECTGSQLSGFPPSYATVVFDNGSLVESTTSATCSRNCCYSPCSGGSGTSVTVENLGCAAGYSWHAVNMSTNAVACAVPGDYSSTYLGFCIKN